MITITDSELWTVLNALHIARDTCRADAAQAVVDDMPGVAAAFRDSALAYALLADLLEERGA